ncbi:MAG: cation-translocating P-type ATPase, partial [Chloroflexi bacterium]|nr:cation-translocating P-type ATPase [Chloroflexota bacterium]
MSRPDNFLVTGLTAAEALERRAKFGENRLPSERATSVWTILLSQVKSPLVYIILVAALVSLFAREYSDFAIIMAVVVIDVILGFVQEFQAQKTYTALKGLLKPTTTVLRDGERREVEVWELVPGDLVLLNAGEKVPGDGALLESTKLAFDEAILTGESEPVNKADEAQAFMGTTVLTGRGLMQVQAIGPATELGRIASSLQEHVEEDTPLQKRLKAFSKTLTWIVAGFTLAILVTGLILGGSFLDMLRTSIILAIAAVPEGLLIAVTVILVIGMRKILKRNGLVKKLLAVETLGSVTVICTDKTGTLTEGRMRVSKAEILDPERALQTMALCNDLEGPVDIAMWEHARQLLNGDPQQMVDGSKRLEEELFTSETKYMITAITGNLFHGQGYNFLKGAPEIVMGMCSIPTEEKARFLRLVDVWAGEGLRMIGLAYRPLGRLDDYSGYTWVGLVGMEDPVREGVVEAIRVAQRAGIQVKMITGDYLKTAEHIAHSIGLMKAGEQSLEGAAVAALSGEELQERVRFTSVFARIRPQDKLRIVKALQANGEITAMIGDGVNDAPALQRANIGVVVGSATDVAKETADLILLDNNFRTIVAAIEEGRIIFQNIRKVVAYTLSNSFAEVLAIFVAMILGWPAPLLVAQILWIHLICDGPSDIVLGFEPKEYGIMDEKPRPLKEPILSHLGLSLIGIISISSAAAVLFLFHHLYSAHGNAVEGRSIVFASFAVNSMVYIFAYRSMRHSLFRMNKLTANMPLVWAVLAGLVMAVLPFLVPGLRELLGIVPLTPGEWLTVSGIA